MSSFVFKRMQEKLIEPDALNLAIRMGAGVFRETARIIQIAADCAIENEKKRITIHDVQRAVREIRSDFKRILKSDIYCTTSVSLSTSMTKPGATYIPPSKSL